MVAPCYDKRLGEKSEFHKEQDVRKLPDPTWVL